MTSGVDMAYAAGGLRDGGSQAGRAADMAGRVADTLRPLACEMAVFGAVAGAAGLAAAVIRSRDAHVQLAEAVATAHIDVQSRAGQIADEGDGLTEQTRTVAAQAAPAGD